MKSCFQCFCFHTAQILSAVKCLCCQLTGFRKTCQKIPKQVGEQIYSWALPRLISNPCWSPHYAAKYTTYQQQYDACNTQLQYGVCVCVCMWYVCSQLCYISVNNNAMRELPYMDNIAILWTPLYGQYCNIVCVCLYIFVVDVWSWN